jgi:hypothetical protein
MRILEQRKLPRPANTFKGGDAIREKSIRVTQPESGNVSFNEIWHAESQRAWNQLLKKYWELIPVDNIQVEYRMNRLTRQDLEAMDEVQWYHFLHDEYFVWKYTAKNRLASTRLHLRKYQEKQDLGRLDARPLSQCGEWFGNCVKMSGQCDLPPAPPSKVDYPVKGP